MNIASRVSYGDFAIIVSGDLEQKAELEILDFDIPVNAQVLELGHHGSKTSTHDDWLRAVDPEFVFWQAGEGNSYGHPHNETLNKLSKLNIPMAGTDKYGEIKILAEKDGSFSVETEKE